MMFTYNYNELVEFYKDQRMWAEFDDSGERVCSLVPISMLPEIFNWTTGNWALVTFVGFRFFRSRDPFKVPVLREEYHIAVKSCGPSFSTEWFYTHDTLRDHLLERIECLNNNHKNG